MVMRIAIYQRYPLVDDTISVVRTKAKELVNLFITINSMQNKNSMFASYNTVRYPRLDIWLSRLFNHAVIYNTPLGD
jgi:hypothetical protein